MKQPIPGHLTWRIGIALLLLAVIFIVHSCRKETKLTQQQINAEIAASSFPVKDAMGWFNGHKAALATQIKINAEVSFLNKIADFTPVWDSARTAVDTNYYVVEAPARYVQRLGFNTDSNAVNINGITRLLVLKSKKYGSTSAVLMHIHGGAGVNINQAHYMDLPQGFSGNIFYTSLQGGFINGYVYKNGKITLISAGKGSGAKPTGPKILQVYVPGYCVEVTTDWYSNTCYWENDGSLNHCTAWEYDYTTVETYCVPGGYMPGTGGGGVTPPNDCPPGGGGDGPPVENYAVKGKLIVKVALPPDDGGGDGGDNPCTPPPPFDIINKIKDTCLRAMVEAARARNIEINAKESMNGIFDTNSNFNLYFYDGPLDPRIDGTTQVQHVGGNPVGNRINVTSMDIDITLNSTTLPNASAEFIAVTILHEVLHAYFATRGTTFDHDVMVREYIPWFTSSMHALYPTISNPDLVALAYGGLMDNATFINSPEYAMKNIYGSINDNYKGGRLGMKCH